MKQLLYVNDKRPQRWRIHLLPTTENKGGIVILQNEYMIVKLFNRSHTYFTFLAFDLFSFRISPGRIETSDCKGQTLSLFPREHVWCHRLNFACCVSRVQSENQAVKMTRRSLKLQGDLLNRRAINTFCITGLRTSLVKMENSIYHSCIMASLN